MTDKKLLELKKETILLKAKRAKQDRRIEKKNKKYMEASARISFLVDKSQKIIENLKII